MPVAREHLLRHSPTGRFVVTIIVLRSSLGVHLEDELRRAGPQRELAELVEHEQLVLA